MVTSKDIVIDVDEVIAHIGPVLERIFNDHTGLNVSRHDWSDYNLDDNYPGLTQQDVCRLIEQEEVYQQLEPIDGSIEAFTRLRNIGYRIHLVTARGFHPQARRLTLDWLNDHGYEYNSLSVTKHGEKKSDAYSQLSDSFGYMVDDHLDNLKDASESGIVQERVVITMPWNVNDTSYVDGINRFDNILKFCEMLEAKQK